MRTWGIWWINSQIMWTHKEETTLLSNHSTRTVIRLYNDSLISWEILVLVLVLFCLGIWVNEHRYILIVFQSSVTSDSLFGFHDIPYSHIYDQDLSVVAGCYNFHLDYVWLTERHIKIWIIPPWMIQMIARDSLFTICKDDSPGVTWVLLVVLSNCVVNRLNEVVV